MIETFSFSSNFMIKSYKTKKFQKNTPKYLFYFALFTYSNCFGKEIVLVFIFLLDEQKNFQ